MELANEHEKELIGKQLSESVSASRQVLDTVSVKQILSFGVKWIIVFWKLIIIALKSIYQAN